MAYSTSYRAPQNTAKRRKLSPKALVLLLLVVALLAAAIFGFAVLTGTSPALNWVSVPAIGRADRIEPFKDGFVSFSQGNLVYWNARGSAVWTRPVTAAEIGLRTSADLIILYSNNFVTVLDANGQQTFQKQLDRYVVGADAMGERVAILTADTTAASLQVYNLNGDVVDEIQLDPSATFDFGIASQDKLWTLQTDLSGSALKTILTTYKPGESTTGIVTGDQLLYDAEFYQNQTFLVGSRNVLCYNDVGESQKSEFVYGWKLEDVWRGKKDIAFAFSDVAASEEEQTASGSINYVKVVKGKSDAVTYKAPKDTLAVCMGEEKVHFITPSAVETVYLANGERKNVALPDSIEAVRVLSGVPGVIVYKGESSYYLPLP
ncbi:DUF5711 family protein [Gehongia tenuis]|uniref:Uncharacterized protein n=1 Tax=Gehongia tenuis TaxID=2763655 RepID=A0A926D475_9FIRM|nr:DUF5711 family protein [Gehongia tenuis]MBC8532090.1 hypothetical protein [Gehongia tenuis]